MAICFSISNFQVRLLRVGNGKESQDAILCEESPNRQTSGESASLPQYLGLDNDEICIKSVVRIGKKKTSNKVDVPWPDDLLNGDEILVDGESESSVHTKSTPMKVTFTNTDVKKSFMKQLSKLKDVDESSPFKSISISHDMTKKERDQNKAMFEETKRLNTEEKSGKHRHIVRGPPWARKIIRVVAKSK